MESLCSAKRMVWWSCCKDLDWYDSQAIHRRFNRLISFSWSFEGSLNRGICLTFQWTWHWYWLGPRWLHMRVTTSGCGCQFSIQGFSPKFSSQLLPGKVSCHEGRWQIYHPRLWWYLPLDRKIIQSNHRHINLQDILAYCIHSKWHNESWKHLVMFLMGWSGFSDGIVYEYIKSGHGILNSDRKMASMNT